MENQFSVGYSVCTLAANCLFSIHRMRYYLDCFNSHGSCWVDVVQENVLLLGNARSELFK
jgi:hypothetical protein